MYLQFYQLVTTMHFGGDSTGLNIQFLDGIYVTVRPIHYGAAKNFSQSPVVEAADAGGE